MENILFQTTDWASVPETEHTGETGIAKWKTVQYPHFRMRLVEYSRNYKADHWCDKGHIVYCLDGEFISELSDGRIYHLTRGMSYQVSDCASEHRSISKHGATLLIIDGRFLQRKEKSINPWKM